MDQIEQHSDIVEADSTVAAVATAATIVEQADQAQLKSQQRIGTHVFDAPVKKEYLVNKDELHKKLNLDFISDEDKLLVQQQQQHVAVQQKSNDLDENKNGLSSANGEPKAKRLRGMNKKRRTLMNERNSERSEVRLCSKFAGSFGLDKYKDKIEQCIHGDACKFSHDVEAWKLVQTPSSPPDHHDHHLQKCYIYSTYGFCGYGLRCKFASSHLDAETHHNLLDESKFYENGPKFGESYKNYLPNDARIALRKKKYDFSTVDELQGPASMEEKQWKKVNFEGKLYLAPLTTVGNLPFRRVCKEYGADITCGEMAMAQNILEGSMSEWALLRRHSSEDIFGVQICGSNQQMLARTCKLINDQCDIDFIDINMGCPIDFVYQNGAGCGLMSRPAKINQILTSMSRVSSVPITMKMRTGVYEGKFLADKLINSVSTQFQDGRIGLITVHGRSREARYTKNANWDYIRQCAQANQNPTSIPIFGSGDILSYEDYEQVLNVDDCKVSGVMIARGALIKPWIFTEIKERRHWDISSKERLEILQRFVNYGLEQWGSDIEGVEKTRRFLLEWLSFLHRYIPVGLLEVLPQKINDRPPAYFGRDELETRFASPYCEDWIKISEMLLGPCRPGFFFLPKHKANAYT